MLKTTSTGAPAGGLVQESGRLLHLARANGDRYAAAEPFPHILFDDFLPPAVLDRVLEEFPAPGDTEWSPSITFRARSSP